jgi:nucleotide-binding universal stress UspA family protein
VARRIAAARPVMTRTALLDGDVVPAMKEYAKANGIDLVVMSTHGRGAFGRFWLGGVADEVVREMAEPVLLVRPGEGKPDLAREIDLKTILVPSDGHLSSEMVLDPAIDLAKLFGSTLDLVRVVEPVLRPAYLPEGFSGAELTSGVLVELREAQAKQEARAKVYLDEVTAGLEQDGYRVETHVLVDERPAAGIAAEAKARHADLIAMETHARRGLSRVFHGSVADKVVRGGGAPVLLHHGPR